MTAYLATDRTRRRFGRTNATTFKPHQASHDLAVAALFVTFTRRWPRLASLWEGEDAYSAERGFGEKIEDALIVRSDKPVLGIEVGAYRADRFEERFRDFAARKLSFRCY